MSAQFVAGSHAHITAGKECITSLQSMDDSEWSLMISGFADGVDAEAEGCVTIPLVATIAKHMAFLLVEDVLYVPEDVLVAIFFLPEPTLEQG